MAINLQDAMKTIEVVLAERDAALAAKASLESSIINACAGSGCLNAHELRVALDAARKAMKTAQEKCEQYIWALGSPAKSRFTNWNEHNIGEVEVHAALEFIHRILGETTLLKRSRER